MMQNPDYFERTRSRLHPKKYRFYFFDYLYYCGDRWSKRNSRVWGSGVIFNYWTFCIWGPVAFWARLNGIHLFSESIDVTIVFAGMLLPSRYASHNFAPITSSNRMINHPNTTAGVPGEASFLPGWWCSDGLSSYCLK